MQFQTIVLNKEGSIATITLNRPEKRNAISQHMTEELRAAIQDVGEDDNVRVLLLAANGPVFCAGVDFGSMGDREKWEKGTMGDEFRRILRKRQQIVLGLRQLEKPTIAMIDGACVGAGVEMVCACDMRFGSEKSRFQVAYTRIGLTPGWGGNWLLPRIVGIGKACELIFTGNFMEAQDADKWGLLNKLVPSADLEKETMALATTVAGVPTIAIRLSKLQIYQGLEYDLETACEVAAGMELITTNSADHREGVRAFMEKRAPRYVGQ